MKKSKPKYLSLVSEPDPLAGDLSGFFCKGGWRAMQFDVMDPHDLEWAFEEEDLSEDDGSDSGSGVAVGAGGAVTSKTLLSVKVVPVSAASGKGKH